MTAGSGIIHQEMPKGDEQGRMHGFQLWANLPSSLKMTTPRYQDVAGEDIPEVVDDDGTRVRVVCGELLGQRAARSTASRRIPIYLDVSVPPGKRKTLPVETTRHAFAYVFAGSGTFRNASDPRAVKTDGIGFAATDRRPTKSAIARCSCSTAATKSRCRPASRAFGSCWCRGSRSKSPSRGTARS